MGMGIGYYFASCSPRDCREKVEEACPARIITRLSILYTLSVSVLAPSIALAFQIFLRVQPRMVRAKHLSLPAAI